MSLEQVEQRLATVENTLGDLLGIVKTLRPGSEARWWEAGGGPLTPEEQKAHEEITEYGRYFRKTGRAAPAGWLPGDPIPEADLES